MAAKTRPIAAWMTICLNRHEPVARFGREQSMTKKVWQAPKVETTPVSMEVTMYLPAQA